MSNGYSCICENSALFINAKFRSINSNGSGEFSQVTVRSLESEKLALATATDNTVEVEYYDVNWQHDGCYTPVNNGDTVKMEGASDGSKVYINGQLGTQVPCPGK